MRRLALALLALPLLALPAQAEMPGVTPDQIGEIFCVSRLGDDDGILTGMLSDELRTLIAYAEARDASFELANPGDKPPLGDGIPWTSFPDYAAECVVASTNISGDNATVVVQYGFPEASDADYSDTRVLRRVAHPWNPDARVWRLDNVVYTTDGDLRAVLDGAFAP